MDFETFLLNLAYDLSVTVVGSFVIWLLQKL